VNYLNANVHSYFLNSHSCLYLLAKSSVRNGHMSIMQTNQSGEREELKGSWLRCQHLLCIEVSIKCLLAEGNELPINRTYTYVRIIIGFPLEWGGGGGGDEDVDGGGVIHSIHSTNDIHVDVDVDANVGNWRSLWFCRTHSDVW